MCFVPPLAKNSERHHQTMATMEPNKCGEAMASHHLEEEGRIAMGGNAVEEEGSDREQTNQTRASMCFVSPLAKKSESHHQTMAGWSRTNVERRVPPIILRSRRESRWGAIQWTRREVTGSERSRGGR